MNTKEYTQRHESRGEDLAKYKDNGGSSENGSVHGIGGNNTHQRTEAKGNTVYS